MIASVKSIKHESYYFLSVCLCLLSVSVILGLLEVFSVYIKNKSIKIQQFCLLKYFPSIYKDDKKLKFQLTFKCIFLNIKCF